MGLRTIVRRLAAMPIREHHRSMVVITSRLEIAELKFWRASSSPTIMLSQLPAASGAELLRDNGLTGAPEEFVQASVDFGGHPLALELLASFLNETHGGDIRSRRFVRPFLDSSDSDRQDHARRVMESYEEDWLKDRPHLLAIMQLIGIFDRPASVECMAALRKSEGLSRLNHSVAQVSEASGRATSTDCARFGC
jgi:hypothetical protein